MAVCLSCRNSRRVSRKNWISLTIGWSGMSWRCFRTAWNLALYLFADALIILSPTMSWFVYSAACFASFVNTLAWSGICEPLCPGGSPWSYDPRATLIPKRPSWDNVSGSGDLKPMSFENRSSFMFPTFMLAWLFPACGRLNSCL